MSLDIEKNILSISWGAKFINAVDCDGKKRFLIIKPLTLRHRNFIEFIYDAALKEAMDLGILTKFELYSRYKTSGVWSAADDEKIEQLNEKIEKLKDFMKHCSGKELTRTKRYLEDLENEYLNIKERRQGLFSISAEQYADEIRSFAVVFCSTYNNDEKPFWENWDDFLNESDNVLLRSVCVGLYTMETLDVKTMRLIARSPLWRFRWNGAKSVGDLFGKPISEFDANQQNLLYWSQVYDSVYEAYERPPDSIIEDDDALDAWFEDQAKKDKAKRVAEKGDIGKVKLSSKLRSSGEIFIVTNKDINPNAPSAQEIDGLNTEFVRKFKQNEVAKIKESGAINEKDLRDRKNKIARKLINSQDAIIKGNSFGQGKGGKSAGTILPGGTI